MHRTIRWFFLFLLAPPPLLAVAQAPAARMEVVKVTTGTGFFINREGDVVTNAHVVQDCRSVHVHTAQGNLPATLRAQDTATDLAVLRVAGAQAEIAPLRWNIDGLKLGDAVMVIGYPGQRGIDGQYLARKTTVTGLLGPRGELDWLQLAHVADHGNSGGPVLDASGNVIAVVNGSAATYRRNPITGEADRTVAPLSITDTAIALVILRDFLENNRVPFYQASSGLVAHADAVLEHQAARFIVPVRCVLGQSR